MTEPSAGEARWRDYLALAHRMADESGAAILRHFRQTLTVEDKEAGKPSFSPVTVADREAETVIEGRAEPVARSGGIAVGVRVFHQKFGYGAVIGIEGDKVEVDFDKAGTKKVVSRFLTAKDDVPF